MGYENCGAREKYPYAELADGHPHVIRCSEYQLRALRYGAKRRGMRLVAHTVRPGLYQIWIVPQGDTSHGWTHPMCCQCWEQRNPLPRLGPPARLVQSPLERCCFCGRPTACGIYMKADPRETLCRQDAERNQEEHGE